MNGKKAKAIRNFIKDAKLANPDQFQDEFYTEDTSKRKMISIDIGDIDENGNKIAKFKDEMIASGQIMLNKKSGRYQYQKLKKLYNKLAHNMRSL